MILKRSFIILAISLAVFPAQAEKSGARFFEAKVRPLLVEHCYDCHSESAAERKGGLLLDRESGWLKGGNTENAIVPGDLDSLFLKAVERRDEDLQMPPKYALSPEAIGIFKHWVKIGAPGPVDDMGQTEFSQLGDQKILFGKAKDHWAFQPVRKVTPPVVDDPHWKRHPIDRFVFDRLRQAGIPPGSVTDARNMARRLSYDLAGLPPSPASVQMFQALESKDRLRTVRTSVEELLAKDTFGEHFARLWLDVARYADTESTYRADTKTPHYFPFAFSYRDYVIDAFNADKPYNQFIKEQLAADRLGLADDAPELAALGFLSVGPHRRSSDNAIDDWIDTTTRGLQGLTVACARCHDHKFEPIPTADYYSLHGVFASITRPHPLNEKAQPTLANYQPSDDSKTDYEKQRAKIEKEITGAGNKKSRNNRRSVAEKIRETKLAELLLFHEGAPARAMVVNEAKRPVSPFIYQRGERTSRGDSVPRRFLRVLDPEQEAFSQADSGRLDLAGKITDKSNPLTARVFVNRVWGFLIGSHLVDTPSDFGLQGSPPTHPDLLDWLAMDFMENDWSIKHLVRQIVTSRTYLLRNQLREDAAKIDPDNKLLWRGNRRHLPIESLRDSLLFTSGELEQRLHGHPGILWGEDHTKRRSIYGYINRFNLDPTLRAFDFPSAMQSAATREESIVAPQALFTMNSPFVIERSSAITQTKGFQTCSTDEARADFLFHQIFQRAPYPGERMRALRLVKQQTRFYNDREAKFPSPWPLVAQALYMSNEFQYLD